jgi:NAD(P)-dependent dehydrogenase (short-subunit alcohol dehydrogenase family)
MKTSWTPDDVPSLAGRRAVVTGANSGIGWHAAAGLARAGAAVTLACRSRERGEEALKRLKAAVPGANARLELLDLGSLASVKAFGSARAATGEPLDLLVNNAGIMAPPRRKLSEDGFEVQLAVNHLGHFALTALLLPVLRKAPAPRVVNVASIAHRRGRLDFDDLMCERRYDPFSSYARTKLANLLFSFELQRRSDRGRWGLRSVAAHPGVARTRIVANGLGGGRRTALVRLIETGMRLFPLTHSEEDGALPTLMAATWPEAEPGGYYGPTGFREMTGRPARVDCRPQAKDEAAARRLWEASERLTGVSFPAA